MQCLKGVVMKVPEAKEYVAVLVDSAGRVLMRSKPVSAGGYFIKVEPPGDKTPSGAIIDSVFEESGLKVKVVSVGAGIYFGGSGTCGYFIVELVGPDEFVRVEDYSVNWYGIDEAVSLISSLKNDSDFELEMAILGVAKNIIDESVILLDDRLKGFVGTAELESFKRLCHLVECTLSRSEDANYGLGINSTFIMMMISEVEREVALQVDFSEYVESLTSELDKKVGYRVRENTLSRLISVFLTQAYSFLVQGDLVGYNNSHRQALGYIKNYKKFYPEESRAISERGYKGGEGKAKKTGEKVRREEMVNQTIMDVLRKNAPFDKRLRPRFIVEKVLDEVVDVLRKQGVERDRKDIDACIMDLLLSDRAAKKVIAGV